MLDIPELPPDLSATLCINCDINVKSVRRSHIVVELHERIVSLINKWVSPRKVEADSELCQVCYSKIIIILQNEEDINKIQRVWGNEKVCPICGINNQREKWWLVKDTNDKQRAIFKHWIAPRQPNNYERFCSGCIRRINTILIKEPLEVCRQQLQNSFKGSTKDSEGVEPVSEPTVVESITLSTYKRVKTNYSLTCSVCKTTEKSRISDKTRYNYLRNNKLYIPDYSRSCQKHLHENVINGWYQTNSFTAKHIEHCISLYKQRL